MPSWREIKASALPGQAEKQKRPVAGDKMHRESKLQNPALGTGKVVGFGLERRRRAAVLLARGRQARASLQSWTRRAGQPTQAPADKESLSGMLASIFIKKT